MKPAGGGSSIEFLIVSKTAQNASGRNDIFSYNYAMIRRKRHRVAAAIYDGLLGFEYAIAAELMGLVRPGLEKTWYEFKPCRVESGELKSSHGFILKPAGGRSDLVHADTVLIPGWRDPQQRPKPAFLNAVIDAYENGARLISICTGAFVLGYAGLLDGRRATTHWLHTDVFKKRFPEVELMVDSLYVHDGRISTSAGSAAGLDLCLSIIRDDFGADVANLVSRRMVAPVHREGGQSQYVKPVVLESDDGDFGPVLDWMGNHLQEPISVEQIARKFAMSLRTFQRRFRNLTGTPPLVWISQQRVAKARNLLEISDLSIDQIAWESGLGSAANLRKHFARHLNVTPSAYRSSFRVTI
jgi:AraC family transcriptional activator FtrA